MLPLDQLYTSQIRNQTGLFANWLPNAPLEIGHYGQINGSLFQPMNQLSGLNQTTGKGTGTYDFTIHATRNINTNAQALADAGLSTGKALLELSFQKEAGVIFSAPDTQVTRVDNIKALGEKLVDMLRAGDWNEMDAIVVEVITANSATIIASISSGAEVKFAVEAETLIGPNVIANLNAGTSLLSEKGVGAKIIGEGPFNPLFRLAFLKSRFLGDPKITFRSGPDEVSPEVVQVSDEYDLEIY